MFYNGTNTYNILFDCFTDFNNFNDLLQNKNQIIKNNINVINVIINIKI